MTSPVDGDSCATTSDCHGASSTTTTRTLLGDSEVDILLRKAGLATRDAALGSSVNIADTECRVGQCRLPKCAQKLATVRTFTAMCCTLAALTGALTAGYVNSVITTIEKRFEIGSSYSGLIAASVEIGGVLSAIVVSYLGSQRHIPNWIGFGALITSFGTLVFTVPHMMAPAYTVTGGINSSRTADNVCHFGRRVDDYYSSDIEVTEKCLSRESGQLNHVLTLVIAQLLIGIGGSPLYTLGTTYIDNHVSKCIAPSYIGTSSFII
jgi:solute carrier organic anion transporter family, member 3A